MSSDGIGLYRECILCISVKRIKRLDVRTSSKIHLGIDKVSIMNRPRDIIHVYLQLFVRLAVVIQVG